MTLVDALLVLARRRENASPLDYRTAYGVLDRVMRDEVRKFTRLDADGHDDIAADACINTVKAVELGRLAPDVAGEAVCRAYCRRATRNLAISALRRRQGVRPETDEVLEHLLACLEPDVDDDAALPGREALVARVLAILGALMDDALAHRQGRYRQPLVDAFEQLRKIAFEGQTIADFIPVSLPDAARRAERLRLQQAHSRCREALAQAVARQEQDGSMTAPAAVRARSSIVALYSCQPTDGARVQGVKS